MSFQPGQILILGFFLIALVAIWKVKNKYFRITTVLVLLALFMVNPFRFDQPGGASLERSVNRFDEIPDKVVVEKPAFSDKQEQEFNKLKSETENIREEITD